MCGLAGSTYDLPHEREQFSPLSGVRIRSLGRSSIVGAHELRELGNCKVQTVQRVQAQSQLPRDAPLEQRPSTNRGRDRGFTGTNGPARGEWNLCHQSSRVRDADRRKGRQFA